MFILVTRAQIDVFAEIKWAFINTTADQVEEAIKRWSEKGWSIEYVGDSADKADQILTAIQRHDIISFSQYLQQLDDVSLQENLNWGLDHPNPRRLIVFSGLSDTYYQMINVQIYLMVRTMLKYPSVFPEVHPEDQLRIPPLSFLNKIPHAFFQTFPPPEPQTSEYAFLQERIQLLTS